MQGRNKPRRGDREWVTSWRPEQIANRPPVDLPDDESTRISHEAIYQALLHSGIDGRADAVANRRSDRLDEFGERGGEMQWAGGGGEFVVATAEILYERESDDDDGGGAVGARAAHGSQPVFG